MNSSTRSVGAAALVAALGLALAACGSPTDAESASGDEIASLDDGAATDDTAADVTDADEDGDDDESVDPEDAFLEFAECMRDHGIDMPDPQVVTEGGERGGAMVVEGGEGFDPNDEEFREADEACSPIMEDARGSIEVDPEQEAEMREQMLEFAQCMRDQGIDFPDPQFDGEGRVTMQIESGPGSGPDVDPEEMQAASEECNVEGTGPGFVFGVSPAEDD